MRLFFAAMVLLAAARMGVAQDVGAQPAGANSEPVVLTRAAAIRSLPSEKAAEGRAVDLKGVVTWRSARRNHAIIVHDGETAVWVTLLGMSSLWERGLAPEPPVCEPGTLVRVKGKTGPGGYAPVVVAEALEPLGTAPLPEPLRLPVEELLSGSRDAQPVEVEGVVQEVTKPDGAGVASAMMVTGGHVCRVDVERGTELDREQLIDARVRVRGALTPLFNLRSQLTALKLSTNGRDDFQVMRPAPADPFQSTRVPLGNLRKFSPDANPYHRVVTGGVVTFAMPGEFFFLQDGATGVRVNSLEAEVAVGDVVEVAAFVDTTRTLAALNGAVVKKTGRAEVPPPETIEATGILQPQFRDSSRRVALADYDGRLVSLVTHVRRVEALDEKGGLGVIAESDGQAFAAVLASSGAAVPTALREKLVPGAEVRFTGLCDLTFAEKTPKLDLIGITGFRLWLRSPEDMVVLKSPPWWTAGRLQAVLITVGLVLALAVASNIALRRVLKRRTRRLEEVMRLHRDSELEFHAAREERHRLAADMHDGLQQLLVSAAYRMEAAAARMGEGPASAKDQLTAAHGALTRAQSGLRECIWGLKQVDDAEEDDFAALLRHAAGTVEHWPKGLVTVEVEGEPYSLSRQVMGSLLMLMQEAVGNACKHGKASAVKVTLHYFPERFEMAIRDNGRGFDPEQAPGTRQGHHGLESMRLRMKWLGGQLKVTSHPGNGTLIVCQVSRTAAEALLTNTGKGGHPGAGETGA
ncbi:sensor histidine kinase [Luteolibacter soli]|uniref:ATP-binding protein n=1 Tax=Luteolibacter soli TaxID=3135280 RepID=A0ABU9AZ69_9BACT